MVIIAALTPERERSIRLLLKGRWTVGRANETTDEVNCRLNLARARWLVRMGLAQSPYGDGSIRPLEDIFFGRPIEITEAGRAYLEAQGDP